MRRDITTLGMSDDGVVAPRWSQICDRTCGDLGLRSR